MKKNKIDFSIIIPIRKRNKLFEKTLHILKSTQNNDNYEIIIVDDNLLKSTPGQKRNFGVSLSSGRYLAFLDDDSYPDPSWLSKAISLFEDKKFRDVSVLCGPTLTPPDSPLLQKVSGLFFESYIGSGGAGLYRNKKMKSRYIDDYQSVNMIVKKEDFVKSRGFDIHFWPGEDTLFCMDIVSRLKKKILYHPDLVVYHYRRSFPYKLLLQLSRYAKHRGLFAKKFPSNSLKLAYFLPSMFFIYVISLPYTIYKFPLIINFLWLYTFMIIFDFLRYISTGKNLLASLIFIFSVPIIHLNYGIFFIIGLLSSDIHANVRPVDTISGDYKK